MDDQVASQRKWETPTKGLNHTMGLRGRNRHSGQGPLVSGVRIQGTIEPQLGLDGPVYFSAISQPIRALPDQPTDQGLVSHHLAGREG